MGQEKKQRRGKQRAGMAKGEEDKDRVTGRKQP